ncbi:ATP-binding protein [Actinomadura rupiterrae]|uniref:ATP-binding protein n=1 Tax=Actinomadura rupiterrae TaxID=559627 RepID=UPI002646431C|nr:helix-turn-helix transcriptional regulator [Actinomadura rupiterrae]MCP2340825.1 DNA-binding CsgD family transcriptional regulator/tetratricopeptide (TPR) repeat protein [Actinomadura rupiterrae]
MKGRVFVGRTTELAALRAAYARAEAGETAVILLAAEAGGGKSRLVEEFVQGKRALIGGCLDLGAASLPYAPFTAILRRLGPETVARLASPAARGELARLLPALGDAAPDAGSGQVRLFEHVLGLIERLGADEPVVLVVEDAHWADRSTRDLLTFLVRNPVPAKVLLIATSRVDDPDVRALFGELARLPHVTRLDLPPLTRTQVAAQVRGLVGGPAPALIRDAHARGGGNPLFVEALVEDPGEAVPGSLRDLLLARFRTLPDTTRAAVRIASAAGDRVGHGLLTAVAGDAGLDEALRPAVERGLLVVDEDGYAFRHALIREAVHLDLLPGERIRLHRRYAEAIEADPALAEAPTSALALHWNACGDHARALEAAWHAADESGHAAAYAECLALLERVLDLWDRVPGPERLVGVDRDEVMLRTARVAITVADFEYGMRIVRTLLESTDDPDETAELLCLRGTFRGFAGQSDDLDDYREAERLASRPNAQRVWVLTHLSSRLSVRGEKAASERLGLEGLKLAAELGGHPAVDGLRVVVASAAARDGLGDLAPLERLRTADLRDDARVRAFTNLSHAYGGAGRVADSLAVVDEGLAFAERTGLTHSVGLALVTNRIEALFLLGRWEEAAGRLRQALDRYHNPAMRIQLGIWAAELRAATGTGPAPEPIALAEPVDSGYPQTALPLAQALINLRLSEDDRPAARATAEAALRHPELTVQPIFTWPLLEAAARAGVLAAPETIAAAPVQGAIATAHAAAVAARTGDPSGWDTALETWERLDHPYNLARTLFEAACADLAAGARKSAANRLHRAEQIAERLGAAPLRRQIAERSRRAGLAGSTGGPLTPRESEVLRLLARGRSNKEIAAELFISPKTASVHVSNLMAKLDASSRTQAAAIAHDRGLL